MNVVKHLINKFSKKHFSLFLVDGIGAIFSAFLYIIVLARFEKLFGIPKNVLFSLGCLAVTYAVFSFTCYIAKPKEWKPLMLTIGIANLLHCFITVALIFFLYKEITSLGIIYIVVEVLIVFPLAVFELKTASIKG